MAPTTQEVILRRLLGFSLIVAVLALVPAANASPPDQSWIAGLYDNADFDDVVLLITSNLGMLQPIMVWALRPIGSAASLVSPADTAPSVLSPPSSGPSRAPPLA